MNVSAQEPWGTYRGNLQRTGCTDGKAGPATPRVLWALKSQENFLAAPVPHAGRLFVLGLGGFNNATFYALDTAPGAARRVAWSKGTPALKLPAVSSPASAGDELIFGDGMHQTDGAVLHALTADKGETVWQLPVPGTLVHLEGSPSVVGTRVYVGGGSAGVLCVDRQRVTFAGKEVSAEQVGKLRAARLKELRAQYEAEKKKDPFAQPPTEDQVPQAAPAVVWRQGQERWHVDAPLAVTGARVLVASAFLDKERKGDRALLCLDSRTGAVAWRTALPLNPWGGPSVSGQRVVVSGSSVGYDPKVLRGARGFVAAFDLADGKEKWRKTVTGGVVGCVALADGLAVASATDGKVRAFDLASGERRWVYTGGTPFFAPVALAGGSAYAADLKGVVHAIDLKTGTARWRLDLGTDPAVKAPGMVYGGPVVQDGRLYLATCNLTGPWAGRPTAVVCIGDK